MIMDLDADGLRQRILARIGSPEARPYGYHRGLLADLAGVPPASISVWLAGGGLETPQTAAIADWVADGMPLPDPPAERTGSRLSAAPLDALALVVADVFGSGSRVALLIAAAGRGTCVAQPPARAAIDALPQVHKERLLAALNLSQLRNRRKLV